MDIFIEPAQPWNTNVRVHMRHRNNCVAKPVEFTKAPENTITEPCFSLEKSEAQQMMDELWKVGFRPSEGSGSAGAMAAVQKHLEDMRTLVFKETN